MLTFFNTVGLGRLMDAHAQETPTKAQGGLMQLLNYFGVLEDHAKLL